MIFGGFPLRCCCRGDTCDRLREAEDRGAVRRGQNQSDAIKGKTIDCVYAFPGGGGSIGIANADSPGATK
jgi:hypothetical protein